jgi:hypothetical protein
MSPNTRWLRAMALRRALTQGEPLSFLLADEIARRNRSRCLRSHECNDRGSESTTPSRKTDPTWFTTQIDVCFNDPSSPT